MFIKWLRFPVSNILTASKSKPTYLPLVRRPTKMCMAYKIIAGMNTVLLWKLWDYKAVLSFSNCTWLVLFDLPVGLWMNNSSCFSNLFISALPSHPSSPWSHAQDCSVCQEDLISTICQHVSSLVLMRSITGIPIMLYFLPVHRNKHSLRRYKMWTSVGVR